MLLLQREQCPEIGIGGYDDPIFSGGASKNLIVGGAPQPAIANVNGVMTLLLQLFGKAGGQRIVDKKFHAAVSGSARSRIAAAA